MRFVCLSVVLSLAALAASPLGAMPPPEPPGNVVLNEIELGASAWIELYNSRAVPMSLTGWQLHLFDASGWSGVYTFSDFTLPGGAYVVVHEGGSADHDTATELYTGWDIPWTNLGGGGAAELLTLFGFTRDYVEFGQDLPFAPTNFWHWSGSYGAVVPDAGKTLGREPGGEDTDRYGDWCGQPATVGAANGECICSTFYGGLPVIKVVLYGTWTEDRVFEGCDTLSLSWPDPADGSPFSLAPGVSFTVRAGRAVIFNTGTNIPLGATLTIEIDPQLRQ